MDGTCQVLEALSSDGRLAAAVLKADVTRGVTRPPEVPGHKYNINRQSEGTWVEQC